MISPDTTRRQFATRGTQRRSFATDFESAHLVGICGSGMKALAELLTDLNWQVTGSDISEPNPTLDAMRQRGLRVHSGHDDQFLPQNADVLVYSPAVGANNPERRRAEDLGVVQMSYSQILGYLMRGQTGVSIAGTHGKSTTTAMTAFVLEAAGLNPSVIVGAELRDLSRSGWAGTGNPFVVESCEYQRSFLDLTPKHAAILGIEPDHFDCYETLNDSITAFSQFVGRVASDGSLLLPADCAASRRCAEASSAAIETFSLTDPAADWWITDARPAGDATRYRVFHQGLFYSEVVLQLPGRHNAHNAVVAIALCHRLGVSRSDIREALVEFHGIRRRFESVGSWRGVTLIDDYAHHPTAVATTLETARKEFGTRRIWCAFQPHQASRTQALLAEFATSFSAADEVLIAPTFAAREQAATADDPSAVELATQISQAGCSARWCVSLDRVIATLEDEVRPGDVLITMGAGDIDRVHHEFTGRLQRNHSPG
jgi:UDP-N-acetylmuramate--alanine ligase